MDKKIFSEHCKIIIRGIRTAGHLRIVRSYGCIDLWR